MRPICYLSSSVICQSVCGSVCALTGGHWGHLANTIEPFVCCGDAALCQMTFTTCCAWCAEQTRASVFRLKKSYIKYDLEKFVFFYGMVNTWYSLRNFVVSANTTDTFKTRLDKFWHNQDILDIISGHSCREPEATASCYTKNLKATFHYAIWSQTGSKLVADLQRAGIWPIV